jgi:hypothetical protein
MLEKLFQQKDLIEPKDLDTAKILSKVKQWELRKRYENGKPGGLAHLRVGKKVFYSRQHLENFFAAMDKQAA